MAKRQSFPIAPAKDITFTDDSHQAQPYYTDQQKRDIEATKQQFRGSEKYKRPIQAKSTSYSQEEPMAYHQNQNQKRSSKPAKKLPKPPSDKKRSSKKDSYGEEEKKESKGLLAKVVDSAKDAVHVAKKEKPKVVETNVVIELPRDILTAFFLLRLPRDESRRKVKKGTERPAFWEDYDLSGKVMLWLTVLLPYFIQWFVLMTLIAELADKWNDLKQNDTAQNDFWWNTVAFAVLFLYMWKDLAAFYFSVWFYVSWLQKKKGGILTNLKDAAVAATEVVTEKAKEVASSEQTHAIDKQVTKEVGKEAVEETKTAIQFIEFKLWLLSVVFLYIGLTCYSLLSIPFEAGLVDKLEISLSIFFVLEVDDWAYQLFIAQANILEDEEFDVVITVKKDRKAVVKQQQKHLCQTLTLVVTSCLGFWILSWALNQI